MLTNQEFSNWLKDLANLISNDNASVALVTIDTDGDVKLAGCGSDINYCLAYLTAIANQSDQQVMH